jgi:hypothetical protein
MHLSCCKNIRLDCYFVGIWSPSIRNQLHHEEDGPTACSLPSLSSSQDETRCKKSRNICFRQTSHLHSFQGVEVFSVATIKLVICKMGSKKQFQYYGKVYQPVCPDANLQPFATFYTHVASRTDTRNDRKILVQTCSFYLILAVPGHALLWLLHTAQFHMKGSNSTTMHCSSR